QQRTVGARCTQGNEIRDLLAELQSTTGGTPYQQLGASVVIQLLELVNRPRGQATGQVSQREARRGGRQRRAAQKAAAIRHQPVIEMEQALFPVGPPGEYIDIIDGQA